MELDLMGRLERSAAAPVVMDTPAVLEEGGVDVRLELSLGLSSGQVGSRKRVRESDEAVEGKKPKMEEGLLPYDLQFMPVILQGPNGYCSLSMMPCWVLRTVNVVGNSVYEPTDNQSLAVEMDGVAAGEFQVEVAGESSSPENSNSGTSILQSFSAQENCSIDESRSHSSCASIDNIRLSSAFNNTKPRLKNLAIHTKEQKKLALSQKCRALVSTRSNEGKKINGYLYQCSESEVRILCDCHGSFFSPTGFVRHAGGPETQHPLRQITVVQSS